MRLRTHAAAATLLVLSWTAAVECADPQVATLEDLYGDAGNSFQGALGYWVQEGIEGLQPFPGYGVGIDDMVIEWREVSRNKDATDCATGSCASLSLAVTNVYEGSGVLVVTVLDRSPWDPVNAKNDCNGDGDYLDPGDDQDCDNDGSQDVTVKGSSTGEPAGEVFALNRVAPGGPQWRGEIPFSVSIDLAGLLYLEPSGSPQGTATRIETTGRGSVAGPPRTRSPARARGLPSFPSLPRSASAPRRSSLGGAPSSST